MIMSNDIKNLKKGILIIAVIIGLFIAPSVISFLQVYTGRKFTMYLVENPKTYKGVKNITLEYFQLADKPFIQEADIRGYDFENGIIYFNPEKKVLDSIAYLNLLGRLFVVCLGKERIYYGTFWTYKIAHGTDTIIAVPDRQGIKLEAGYFGMDKNFASLIHSNKIRTRFARISKLL